MNSYWMILKETRGYRTLKNEAPDRSVEKLWKKTNYRMNEGSEAKRVNSAILLFSCILRFLPCSFRTLDVYSVLRIKCLAQDFDCCFMHG
jgi:hypothetical protein